MELESKEIDQYVPTCESEDKKPSKPCLLRCDYPIFDNTSTNDNIPGERMKLESKEHDEDMLTNDSNPGIDRPGMSRYYLRAMHVPIGGPDIIIDPPSKSRYPLRSKNRTSEDPITLVEGLGSIQQASDENRFVVDGFQWMDIKDLPLRTGGAYSVCNRSMPMLGTGEGLRH